jgi:hypothetical protein
LPYDTFIFEEKNMKKATLLVLNLLFIVNLYGQISKNDSCTFFNPCPKNYDVKHAVEVESLVPMFLYGGYHVAACYRYKKFRVRMSVINGGKYNAENAGINNHAGGFSRYYTKTGYGIFLGYNIWKNLEVYTYIERHHFKIEEKVTGEKALINSTDFGIAASYQVFIGRILYLQPGIHFYFRKSQTLQFVDQKKYTIPAMDISPVIRLGFRICRKY